MCLFPKRIQKLLDINECKFYIRLQGYIIE